VLAPFFPQILRWSPTHPLPFRGLCELFSHAGHDASLLNLALLRVRGTFFRGAPPLKSKGSFLFFFVFHLFFSVGLSRLFLLDALLFFFFLACGIVPLMFRCVGLFFPFFPAHLELFLFFESRGLFLIHLVFSSDVLTKPLRLAELVSPLLPTVEKGGVPPPSGRPPSDTRRNFFNPLSSGRPKRS